MDPACLEVLRQEFTASDGSFLIQLRPGLVWDKEAFSRLVTAMEACCKAYEGKESLERWLAQGFWYLPWFVKHWTGHPNFPRPQPEEYYTNAIDRLSDLAYWFFMGYSPYEGGHQLDRL